MQTACAWSVSGSLESYVVKLKPRWTNVEGLVINVNPFFLSSSSQALDSILYSSILPLSPTRAFMYHRVPNPKKPPQTAGLHAQVPQTRRPSAARLRSMHGANRRALSVLRSICTLERLFSYATTLTCWEGGHICGSQNTYCCCVGHIALTPASCVWAVDRLHSAIESLNRVFSLLFWPFC